MKDITLPVFDIKSSAPISQAFLQRTIHNFESACVFVMQLPYRRNTDKKNLLTVFSDACGTCSTKHALLKRLAIENEFEDLQLMLGIFKMTAENTPEVAETLAKNKLEYVPEAHNYLMYKGKLLDLTKPGFKLSRNKRDHLTELEIMPHQITDYKIAYHKNFLRNWLKTNPELKLSLEELWEIKEQCIADLAVV